MSQCPSIFVSRSSRGHSVVWCTRQEGHGGDHRGYRKQWNANGEKVKISIPADEQWSDMMKIADEVSR